MKVTVLRRAGASCALAAGLVSCATQTAPAPPPPPAPKTAQAAAPASPPFEEGSSVEAAVIAPASSERAGVAWENDWIYSHYGRFRKKTVAVASREGRRYDVITVELADHTEKTLYFDITDFFGK